MKERLKRRNLSHRNKKSFSGSFRAKKKRNKHKILLFIILVCFFILISFLVYLFFISNFFHIKEIKVENIINENTQIKNLNEDDFIKNEELEGIIKRQIEEGRGLLPQKNIVFFSKKKLNESLGDYNFANISLKKNIWQKRLSLQVKEREEALLYLENGIYYFLDKSADVVKTQKSCEQVKLEAEEIAKKKAEEENLKQLNNSENQSSENLETAEKLVKEDNSPLISSSEDHLDNSANINCLDLKKDFGEEIFLPLVENISDSKRLSENKKHVNLSEEYLSFVFNLYSGLGGESELNFKKIILDEERDTVKLKLNNNLDIYLSLKYPFEEQISKFFIISRERPSELVGKKYIDLRYGDKIFCY